MAKIILTSLGGYMVMYILTVYHQLSMCIVSKRRHLKRLSKENDTNMWVEMNNEVNAI